MMMLSGGTTHYNQAAVCSCLAQSAHRATCTFHISHCTYIAYSTLHTAHGTQHMTNCTKNIAQTLNMAQISFCTSHISLHTRNINILKTQQRQAKIRTIFQLKVDLCTLYHLQYSHQHPGTLQLETRGSEGGLGGPNLALPSSTLHYLLI